LEQRIEHQLLEGGLYDLQNVSVHIEYFKSIFVQDIYEEFYAMHIEDIYVFTRIVGSITFKLFAHHTPFTNIYNRIDFNTLVGKYDLVLKIIILIIFYLNYDAQ
jgi:hypothetical protein